MAVLWIEFYMDTFSVGVQVNYTIVAPSSGLGRSVKGICAKKYSHIHLGGGRRKTVVAYCCMEEKYMS